MTSADQSIDFVITRTFNAPRALVFDTMTQTEHLQKWWGPQGCTIDVVTHELKAGGVFHYCMKFGAMPGMYGKFQYREVTRPERIVFLSGFADAQGHSIRNAMSPTWPLEMLNTVTLDDEGSATKMTLRSTPHNASPIEIETFKAGHASMAGGFGGMYEVYEKYLASL